LSKDPFEKDFLFSGKVDGALKIHDQPSFQMVEFVLSNAGKKIRIPLADSIAVAIAGSDFDFRETVYLYLNVRAG